jgi:sensor domain CHASE-containing protein
MEIFVPIANVLLSVVAIIIAIRSSRKTSQDAIRQIESIKQLSKIQVEVMRVKIESEVQKNKLLTQQAREEWQKIENIRKPQFGRTYEDEERRKLAEERPRKQIEFYDTCIQNLNEISRKLAKLEEKLK